MAQYLELASSRRKLAAAVRPLLEDASVVGFPAVCGLTRTAEVLADLHQRIGRPVFEIPTLPPAVTGLRLKYTFERALPELGVRTFYQNKVTAIKSADATSLTYRLACGDEIRRIRAQATVLASGRFIGRGLRADRQKIHETIFDLPVTQPPNRRDWHRPEFLDRRGHRANRAGLEIDSGFRPRQADGRPAFQHLYAAGSILAHADWMRMKCGAGLAIATAYGAVNAFQAWRDSGGQSQLDESSRPPLAGNPRGW
jgi:glycerol-3-phosphate dehydrogenase subunit B